MPVEREHIQALGVLRCYLAQKSERHNDRDYDQADSDVKRVLADQRVVGGAEKIRADGQALMKYQSLPLESCPN